MKIMAVLILIHGLFWSTYQEHRYFNNYTDCHSALDRWLNDNSGFMKAARGFCISNPDYHDLGCADGDSIIGTRCLKNLYR